MDRKPHWAHFCPGTGAKMGAFKTGTRPHTARVMGGRSWRETAQQARSWMSRGCPSHPAGGAKSSLGVRGWDCLGHSWRTGCVTHITAGWGGAGHHCLCSYLPSAPVPKTFSFPPLLLPQTGMGFAAHLPRKASDSGRCPHWGSPGAESRR